ncbi:MAG: hypothetical protein U5O16_38215 [Rhodococcus sp. (in: high G+C Gram-positive bacteria)]|uniref:hypothetical protein n=1 Tax=Rhodococcus sp. TaxID=1831 RepID=UPI002AD64F95|nr:hypothetical protein [Rhodococcus sp. (in: high G+C Gram-positive bacteria)]
MPDITLPALATPAETTTHLAPGDGKATTPIKRLIGSTPARGQVLLELTRFDGLDDNGDLEPSRWYLQFSEATNDEPELHPSEIPALIDALTEMHRAWLHLDPECFA